MLLNSRFLFLIFILVGLFSTDVMSQKKIESLQKIMQKSKYGGVIVLYDLNEDEFVTSHFNKTDEKVLPGATFDIFNTLLFFKYGLAKDTSYTLPWSGKEYKHKGKKVDSWCKDNSLADAFRNNTNWYFKAISNPIEFLTYKEIMKKHKYGKVFGRDKDDIDFWNSGEKIGISARDQIRFLVRLYDDNTTFETEHVNTVKELMLEHKTDDYTLRSKTGWTESPEESYSGRIDLGWYIGYVETKDNTYFFAIRLEKPLKQRNKTFAEDRKDIARKALLKHYGLEIK